MNLLRYSSLLGLVFSSPQNSAETQIHSPTGIRHGGVGHSLGLWQNQESIGKDGIISPERGVGVDLGLVPGFSISSPLADVSTVSVAASSTAAETTMVPTSSALSSISFTTLSSSETISVTIFSSLTTQAPLVTSSPSHTNDPSVNTKVAAVSFKAAADPLASHHSDNIPPAASSMALKNGLLSSSPNTHSSSSAGASLGGIDGAVSDDLQASAPITGAGNTPMSDPANAGVTERTDASSSSLTPTNPSSPTSSSSVVTIVCSVLAVGVAALAGFVGYRRYNKSSSFSRSLMSKNDALHSDFDGFVECDPKHLSEEQLQSLPPLNPLGGFDLSDGSKLNYPQKTFKVALGHSSIYSDIYPATTTTTTPPPAIEKDLVDSLESIRKESNDTIFYSNSQHSQSQNGFSSNHSFHSSPADDAAFAVAAASLQAASQDSYSMEEADKYDSMLFGSEYISDDYVSSSDLFFQ